MGPTALQARIAAFEALNNGDDSSLKSLVSAADDNDAPSSPRSPTAADTQASVIDLKDWVIEDRPSLSSSSSLTSSPAAVARLSPPVLSRPTPSPRSSNAPVPPPRIQVGTPPRQRSPVSRSIPLAAPAPAPAPALAAPPLPPRKSSSPTCTTAASAAAKRKPVVPVSSSSTSPPLSSASSNMLMVPQSEHSYPPDGSRMSRGHAQASSISSFHSISLSSDAGSASDSATSPYLQTFPIEREDDKDDSSSDGNDDIDSLNESFENVSTPSNSSYAPSLPSTLLRAGKPPPPLGAKPASRFGSPVPSTPRLPPRSPSGASTPPTQPSTPSGYARRVPPPPPPPLTSSQPGTSAGPLPYTPRQRARSNSRAPSVRSSIQSNSTTTTTTTTATLSDRSSILSRTTSLSSFSQTSTTKAPSSSSTTSTSRAGIRLPPIPPPVRARYDALFTANVRARILAHQRTAGKPTHLGVPAPKRRANAGWRGLSVDLIPTDNAALLEDAAKDRERAESDEGAEEDVVIPADARIPAGAVKRMWALSRLDRARLREIWEECQDPATARDKAGAKDGLDREAFARGMWRIDEELRRAAVTGSARRGVGAGAKAHRRAR